jgi:prepilin-type processing-associated H-X9-DG protein
VNKSNYLHSDGHVAGMIISEALRGSKQYNWYFFPEGYFLAGPVQK